VLTYLGHEYDRGLSMVDQATAINENLAVAWYSRGWVALLYGDGERSIESFDRMIKLSPADPLKVSAWNGISWALFLLGRYDEGCTTAAKLVQFVADAHSLGAYIANFVCAGRTLEAQDAAMRLLKLHPGFRASHASEAFPVRLPVLRDRIVAALREGGVPG
jgi:tetratricopeptide (TPR) repeat protein